MLVKRTLVDVRRLRWGCERMMSGHAMSAGTSSGPADSPALSASFASPFPHVWRVANTMRAVNVADTARGTRRNNVICRGGNGGTRSGPHATRTHTATATRTHTATATHSHSHTHTQPHTHTHTHIHSRQHLPCMPRVRQWLARAPVSLLRCVRAVVGHTRCCRPRNQLYPGAVPHRSTCQVAKPPSLCPAHQHRITP